METSVQIKRLGKEDVVLFGQLIAVFNEVFENKIKTIPAQEHLLKLLSDPAFFAYAVITENTIAGGLTAYELTNYYSETSEIFIYDIAIATAFQHKGYGKQLVVTLKEYCKANNVGTIFVAAHEADTHASEFYHATGGKAEKVIHFNYTLGQENK